MVIDVKIRQRAQKKGVTLGDLTSWNSTPAEGMSSFFIVCTCVFV